MRNPVLDLSQQGRAFVAAILMHLRPPPDLKVSEWASEHRIIAQGNAEPGRWRNDRAPYLVEPMDALNDDDLHTIVIAGCSQSGKTSIAENLVGYIASCDPCTVVWVTPSDDSASNAGVRFDKMVEASPSLAKSFGTRTARSRVNNAGLKEFRGGQLVLASAGSPTSLASHPARVVILDEVSRYPASTRKEGDPVGIARARMTTFSRKKLVAISSPLQMGSCRIEALFADGDRREWFWECDCGSNHVPEFEHVTYTPGDPASARYQMPCCGQILDDANRWQAMVRGRWIATSDKGRPGVRSYRFRGLSSPWIRLQEIVAGYEAALGKPTLMQPWMNTVVGLPFENAGQAADADTVKALALSYPGDECPREAGLVTAGIDIQGGWAFVGIVAWGSGDEGWALQLHEVPGDIKDPNTFRHIEQLLQQRFRHPSGELLPVEAVACDAGYETQTVVEWSLKNRVAGRRWFSIKGVPGFDKQLFGRSEANRASPRLWNVASDAAKERVMTGLVTPEGSGAIHMRTAFREEYFEWAVAEELHTLDNGKREWRRRRGARRNETLDVLSYALAVAHSADFDVEARLRRLATSGTLKPQRTSIADLAKRAAALTTEPSDVR